MAAIQAMFGGGPGVVIEGKKRLLFLLKTLTRFVPYDPVFVLKVSTTLWVVSRSGPNSTVTGTHHSPSSAVAKVPLPA